MRRLPGRPRAIADGDLRARIITAATKEFASAGYRGARLQAIAEAAGCNRSLIYFYFKSKARLLKATLEAAAENRRRQMAAQPARLADGLVYWFQQNRAEPERIHLIMREALAGIPAEASTSRPAYLEDQLRTVELFQKAGLLRSDLDARLLLTMFLALTSFPVCFPAIANLALGAASEDAAADKWSACLEQIAQLLVPSTKSRRNRAGVQPPVGG